MITLIKIDYADKNKARNSTICFKSVRSFFLVSVIIYKFMILNNQHRVAIAVKAVFFGDRMFIGFFSKFLAHERGNKY